jgi:hypothetical protein
MNITPPDEPPERDLPEADRADQTDRTVAAVDPLDERLSAALDGAADPESPPVEHSDDTRVAERLRALEASRDLLAIPPPPLDDLTRRRMLRAAIAATGSRTSKRRDLRWLNRTGIAAALLALVVLAGWGIKSLDVNSNDGRASSKAASSATTRATATAPSVLPDLHEVSDPAVLERRVEAALNTQERTGATAQTDTRAPAPSPPSTTFDRIAPEQDVCVSKVPVPAGVTPGLLGTATFHDEPALVIVARDQSRTLIFVVARSDCRRLSSQLINH